MSKKEPTPFEKFQKLAKRVVNAPKPQREQNEKPKNA